MSQRGSPAECYPTSSGHKAVSDSLVPAWHGSRVHRPPSRQPHFSTFTFAIPHLNTLQQTFLKFHDLGQASADVHDPSSETRDLHSQIFVSATTIMCFYIQYQFDCDDFQIGPFDQHCAVFDCGNGTPCLGTDDPTDSCPAASSACDWMGVTKMVRRDGDCRTCRGVILKDERRIRGEILLRYTAIDVVEETLLRHRQRMIRRQREPSTNYADWIAHQEDRIQRYEQAILFLASGSEEKETYVAAFLKNVEQRQVDREVGVLEVQHEVLERKRLEAWNDIATILDLNT